MRARPLLLGLLWASVTLALTLTTWLAVSLVAEEVGGSGTQVLSADAVQSAAGSAAPSNAPTPGHSPAATSKSPRPHNSATQHPSSSVSATSHPSSSPHSSPHSTPRSTPRSSSGPSGSGSASSPATKSRTFAVTGGTVAAACTGSTIALRSAQPANGWRVEVKDRGPEHVEVSFRSGEQENEVKIRCSGGVPVAETDDNDDSPSDH